MPAFVDLATLGPVSVLTVLVLVRYGPVALVTVVAGLVAALSRHGRRGQRALDVLTLLHGAPRRGDKRPDD